MCGEQSRAWPSSPRELPPLAVYAGSRWRPHLLGGREHGKATAGWGPEPRAHCETPASRGAQASKCCGFMRFSNREASINTSPDY